MVKRTIPKFFSFVEQRDKGLTKEEQLKVRASATRKPSTISINVLAWKVQLSKFLKHYACDLHFWKQGAGLSRLFFFCLILKCIKVATEEFIGPNMGLLP